MTAGESDDPSVDQPHAKRGEGQENTVHAERCRRHEMRNDFYAGDAATDANDLAERDRQKAIANVSGGEFHLEGLELSEPKAGWGTVDF